eukprot:scaffold206743_cov14-Tisochrysis_lutea.AAC.1
MQTGDHVCMHLWKRGLWSMRLHTHVHAAPQVAEQGGGCRPSGRPCQRQQQQAAHAQHRY